MSYQGSAGVGLLNCWDHNSIPLDISTDRTVLDQVYKDPQSYKPFTNFGAVSLWSNFGHSTYHSGTLKVEKRFSHGLTMTSFYTRSKAIDDSDNDQSVSGITYYNRSLEKGRASFDLTNRFVTLCDVRLAGGQGAEMAEFRRASKTTSSEVGSSPSFRPSRAARR